MLLEKGGEIIPGRMKRQDQGKNITQLISFRINWLDLLAVQGTLQSLLLCCWKRVFAMTSAFSWQNSISLCPASLRIPRPNLPVTPGVS